MGRPKVMIVGLDCAEPSLAFERFAPAMPNLRRLMRDGTWGRIRSTVPPVTVPAWACLAAGADPGELGLYGFHNRAGYDRYDMEIVTSASVKAARIWDVVGDAGGRSTVLFVPPGYPPLPIRGSFASCCLTPGPASDWTRPAEMKDSLASRFGDYVPDVADYRTDDKDRLLRAIHEMSRQHFGMARFMLERDDWDLFFMVEMGCDRLHHGFWSCFAEDHPRFRPGNPWQDVGHDYYAYVDRELGTLLEYADDDTTVLVVSDHGARTMRGGIRVNDWLVRHGWLSLQREPDRPMTLAEAGIDWSRTRAWGEGGYYGRVFLNVAGREPQGVIPPERYEDECEMLRHRLEAVTDPEGRPLGTVVHRPRDLYPVVRGTPPDLIVLFGDLAWRSIGTVGHESIHAMENDTGPDDANHAWEGVLVMAGAGVPAAGPIEGSHLRDVARTVLRLLGVTPPITMGGHDLLAGLRAPGAVRDTVIP